MPRRNSAKYEVTTVATDTQQRIPFSVVFLVHNILHSLRCLGSKRSNIWEFYGTENTNVLIFWTVVIFSSHVT
jgi:hypothetical protein